MRLSPLLLPLLAALPVRAEVACPPRLDLTPRVEPRAPEGWRVIATRQTHWLRNADLCVGDPEARVQLRPEEDRARKRLWWDLGNDTHTLVCLYEGTEVSLAAPVPAGHRRCTVETYRENSRGIRFGRPVIGPDDWGRVTCR